MLNISTYNKKHTKTKQTESLPLLFYPQTLQCPTKFLQKLKQVVEKKKKAAAKNSLAAKQYLPQSATKSKSQHKREHHQTVSG